MLDDFFILLRSGLWGTEPSGFKALTQAQWQQLLTTARKQTVLPLVADAISRLPQQLAPDASTIESLLKFSARSMMTHTLLDSSVAKVAAFYRSRGIEGVLLKGQGIARYYPNALLRQCGYIDLYIGEENYQKSVELAMQHLESGEEEAKESIKHYHFNMGGVVVELHRIAAQMAAPVRRQKFQHWLVAELEDSSRRRTIEINGTDVNVPSADFNVFFVFYHAWYHLTHGGIGMRQLCDWAMVLNAHASAIDCEALERRLRSWGCYKPWQILGAIVVERLGLPESKMPLYDHKISSRYPWVMEKVIDGGNFGHHRSGIKREEIRKMPLLHRKKVQLKELMDTYTKIFPVIPIESTCMVGSILSVAAVKTVKQLIRGK